MYNEDEIIEYMDQLEEAGWFECSHCGQLRAPDDGDDHSYGAKGTSYACVGEIDNLPPRKRKAAIAQHELWSNKRKPW